MNSAHTLQLTELPSINRLSKYFMRRWLRRSPAFVRTCRLLMQAGSGVTLFRLIYVAKSSNYTAAERSAEEFVARLLHDQTFGSEKVIDIQWKRGRLVTSETLDAEDAYIGNALCRISQSSQSELLIYERIENYQAKSAPASPQLELRSSDIRHFKNRRIKPQSYREPRRKIQEGSSSGVET